MPWMWHGRRGVFAVILLGENSKEKAAPSKSDCLVQPYQVCSESKPDCFSRHRLATVARRSLLQLLLQGIGEEILLQKLQK